MDFLRLPTFGKDGAVHLVIEAPRGARAKFKFEPGLCAFVYSRPLALGVVYPFDWGFMPSTCAPDGDPLDGMVIHAAASYPGTIVPCQTLGVLEVEQTELGKTKRNDRLVLRPSDAAHGSDLGSLLTDEVEQELESFFRSAAQGTQKKLRFLGWRDARAALDAIREANREFERRNKA